MCQTARVVQDAHVRQQHGISICWWVAHASRPGLDGVQVWALLLQPEGTSSLMSTAMPPAASAATASVFEALVAACLREAARSAHEVCPAPVLAEWNWC